MTFCNCQPFCFWQNLMKWLVSVQMTIGYRQPFCFWHHPLKWLVGVQMTISKCQSFCFWQHRLQWLVGVQITIGYYQSFCFWQHRLKWLVGVQTTIALHFSKQHCSVGVHFAFTLIQMCPNAFCLYFYFLMCYFTCKLCIGFLCSNHLMLPSMFIVSQLTVFVF